MRPSERDEAWTGQTTINLAASPSAHFPVQFETNQAPRGLQPRYWSSFLLCCSRICCFPHASFLLTACSFSPSRSLINCAQPSSLPSPHPGHHQASSCALQLDINTSSPRVDRSASDGLVSLRVCCWPTCTRKQHASSRITPRCRPLPAMDLAQREQRCDAGRPLDCHQPRNPSRRQKQSRVATSSWAVALLAASVPVTMAQQCISLSGSKACPAFANASISINSDLTGTLYVATHVSLTPQLITTKQLVPVLCVRRQQLR